MYHKQKTVSMLLPLLLTVNIFSKEILEQKSNINLIGPLQVPHEDLKISIFEVSRNSKKLRRLAEITTNLPFDVTHCNCLSLVLIRRITHCHS